MEDSATIHGLPKTIGKEIDSKLKFLRNNFEAKFYKLIEKQEKPARP